MLMLRNSVILIFSIFFISCVTNKKNTKSPYSLICIEATESFRSKRIDTIFFITKDINLSNEIFARRVIIFDEFGDKITETKDTLEIECNVINVDAKQFLEKASFILNGKVFPLSDAKYELKLINDKNEISKRFTVKPFQKQGVKLTEYKKIIISEFSFYLDSVTLYSDMSLLLGKL